MTKQLILTIARIKAVQKIKNNLTTDGSEILRTFVNAIEERSAENEKHKARIEALEE